MGYELYSKTSHFQLTRPIHYEFSTIRRSKLPLTPRQCTATCRTEKTTKLHPKLLPIKPIRDPINEKKPPY